MPFFLPFIPAAAAALPPVAAAAAAALPPVVAAATGVIAVTSTAIHKKTKRISNLEHDLHDEKTQSESLKTENENLKTEKERLEHELTDQRLQNENLERQRLDQQAAISNLTNAANVMSTKMSALNADMDTKNADMDAKMTMMLQMMLQMNQRMNGLPMPPAGTLGIESPMKPLVAIKGCEYVTSTSGERTATAESEVLVTTADDKPNDEVPNDIESTMDHEVFVNDNGPAIMNDAGQFDIIHGSIRRPQESCVADVTLIF